MPAKKKSTIPDGVKQPADRLAKAEATDGSVTFEHNGTYTISAQTFNDVEILEMVGDMQDNPLLLPKVCRTILGVEQWQAWKDASRLDDGRVPGEAMHALFTAMDDAVGNSAASPGF